MAGKIFVDTGAWVALINRRDQYHRAAKTAQHNLRRRSPQWITTNLVIAEAYGLLRRVGHPPAMQFLLRLRNTAGLVIVRSGDDLEDQAEEMLRKYADQDFSYTDAVSFAVMRERQITSAFTFDHHFETAGFQVVPTL